MNKQELIKRIAGSRWNDWAVEDIMNRIDAEGWLRNPGKPIDPADIRKGDRYLVVYEDGEEHVQVAEGPRSRAAVSRFFLLDRPKPEPTNAEKLKVVLDAIGDSTSGYREHLASKLDEAGVKAPGGDDSSKARSDAAWEVNIDRQGGA